MQFYSNHVCTLDDDTTEALKKMSHFNMKFWGIKLVSIRNPMTKFYFRSLDSIDKERKRHMALKYKHIIHPFCLFRVWWDAIFVILFYAHLIIVPLNILFMPSSVNPNYLGYFAYTTIAEAVLDFLNFIDIILQFCTGFCLPAKKEVTLIPTVINRLYMTSFGFYCDVISCFPMYLVTRISCYFLPHLRLSKILRICESLCFFKLLRMKKFLLYLNHTTELIRKYYYSRRCVQYFFVTILVFHWSTCMYITISEWFYFFKSEDEFVVPSMSTRNALLYDYITIYCQSLQKVSSYLLGISIVTGFRRTIYFQITEPRELTCFLIFSPIGYVLCNFTLVLILQMMISKNSSEIKYNEILSQVNCYVKHKELPKNMKERILSYYDYRFQKKYFRETTIMDMLSETLRRDINLHSCRTLIDSVPLLKDLPSEIISEVVHHLKHEVFLYNDIIVKAGTVGDCMYFISNGTVAVSTPTGKEICHLQDGAYFGEIALVSNDQKRVANVVAIEICDIYRLDRRNFKRCFPVNSLFYKKIEQIAQERKEKTILLEELHKKYVLERTTKTKAEEFLNIDLF